ncbi:HAMP domain-containing protein [Aggregicoccus sp. 17bor-14]|uniref:sensor histidine kinase n=1 Tax=Myxococcaceae TaxID=31 RepID=UPI00129C1B82|nr:MULTISPECIES: ATP-binding protein [Myxococcaceae]MBF5044226.1 HAMP domain-containing protein [Simulacricoccus sp. 17bor-14]MRI89976.1 HAMP domain-containing protein [Aggregicoccus sp. 17bor-14]
MRLYQQLVLFMLAATVLPLAVVGFLLLSRAEATLVERLDAEQRGLAQAAAEGASAELLATVDALARSAELIDWEHASPAELRGGLSLLYGQSPAVSAVLQVDAQGLPLGEPVFESDASRGHPGFDPAATPALVRAVQVQGLRRGGKGQAALGSAYAHSRGAGAAIALAVKLGEGPEASFALAELVLTRVEALLARRAAGGLARVELVDGGGRVLASSVPGRALQPLEPALRQELPSFRAGSPPQRVSSAPLPEGLGLRVVVSVDEGAALAPVRTMRRTVFVSVAAALGVLLVLGGLFTRRLNGRLSQVVEGAEAFGRGELERRLPVEGEDELSALATTFNRMGEELQASRARLLRWNDDLRVRVDEATAELRAAQAELVEAQKLAAIGQLGAGVAHEINNPLAGILGNAQLMLLDRSEQDPDWDSLRKIEQSAKRCKEITQNLLRFSQQRARPELRPMDLNASVRDALGLTEHETRGEGVSLQLQLSPAPVRVRADPGHLSQVLLHLLSNARTAMRAAPVKQLTLRTGEADGQGYVEVVDTGKGIAPEHLPRIFEPFFTTKEVWSNVGLGLSVVYRVVQEAGGRVEVQSEVGHGSRFTVRLPRA